MTNTGDDRSDGDGFQIGDTIRLKRTGEVRQVLAVGQCDDFPAFGCHPTIVKYVDDDRGWIHSDEIEKTIELNGTETVR